MSDVLADIYIDPMGRRLSRAGFTVSRFADDFRVACRSYPEALEVWEEADRAARYLGLVLNESKTSTPRRDTYEARLDAVANREAELFDDLEVEVLVEPGLYEDVIFTIPVEGSTTLSSEPDFDEADVSHNSGSDDLERTHAGVAAEAAVALARRGMVQPDGIDRVIRRMPPAHRLTAVMALGALGDEERAVNAADSAVEKLVVEWALEHLA